MAQMLRKVREEQVVNKRNLIADQARKDEAESQRVLRFVLSLPHVKIKVQNEL